MNFYNSSSIDENKLDNFEIYEHLNLQHMNIFEQKLLFFQEFFLILNQVSHILKNHLTAN